jgi:hypothetical protein
VQDSCSGRGPATTARSEEARVRYRSCGCTWPRELCARAASVKVKNLATAFLCRRRFSCRAANDVRGLGHDERLGHVDLLEGALRGRQRQIDKSRRRARTNRQTDTHTPLGGDASSPQHRINTLRSDTTQTHRHMHTLRWETTPLAALSYGTTLKATHSHTNTSTNQQQQRISRF